VTQNFKEKQDTRWLTDSQYVHQWRSQRGEGFGGSNPQWK